MTHEEDKEFEEARKYMNTLGLKKSLREQGIDTKKLPMYKLDEIRRALDRSQSIQNKYNPKFKELQDKQQKEMNELNTQMQADATEARSEIDKLINQIKTDQGIMGVSQPDLPGQRQDAEQKQEPAKDNVS